MKTLITILALILATLAGAQTHVRVYLPAFNADPATNRYVAVQPLQPFRGNVTRYYSGTNDYIYVSNALRADYLTTIERRGSSAEIAFQFTVTATNLGVIDAHTNTTVKGQMSYPVSGQSSWTIDASDARYATIGSTGSGSGETNFLGSVGESTSLVAGKDGTTNQVKSLAVSGGMLSISSTASNVTVDLPEGAVLNLLDEFAVLRHGTSNNATLNGAITINSTLNVNDFLTGTLAVFSGNVTSTGGSFIGDGSLLTSLNAGQLGSGTIPGARFPAILPAVRGDLLTDLNASELQSGTVPPARLATNAATSGKMLFATSASTAKWDDAPSSGLDGEALADALASGTNSVSSTNFTGTANNMAFLGSNYFQTVYASNVVGNASGLSNIQRATMAGSLSGADPWSIIIIPDTQYLTARTGGPAAFTNLVNWITNNVARYNIKAVLHEGDIVENYNNAGEWGIASALMTRLRTAGLPVILAQGNHDWDAQNTRSFTNFNAYFPQGWFSSGTVFESETNAVNHYLLQTNSGVPWLWLSYEMAPRQHILDWVTNTMTTYSNHNVGIVTHAYCTSDGTLENSSSAFNSGGMIAGGKNADYVWTNALSRFKNLRFIANGHFSDVATATNQNAINLKQIGDNGNTVYAMLFNYQTLTDTGVAQTNSASLRKIEFEPSSLRAGVSTFNPSTGVWDRNLSAQFGLDWTDGSFAAQISHSATIEGKLSAELALASSNRWVLRSTLTDSKLEIRAGTATAPTSNNVVLRLGTNGLIEGATQFAPVHGQVVYLPFDEGRGRIAVDRVNGYTATNSVNAYGTNLWFNGVSGAAAGLAVANAGWGNCFVLTNAPSFSSLTSVTVSVWVRLGALSVVQAVVAAVHSGGTDGMWNLTFTATDGLRWTTIANAGARDDMDQSVSVFDGQWHHLVATHDGNTTKRIYVDGALVATKTTLTGGAGPLLPSAHPLTIGESASTIGGPNYGFNGGIDELRVFNRALTAAEVSALYKFHGNGAPSMAAYQSYNHWSGGPGTWPTRPLFPGAFQTVYSNGFGFVLISTNGGGGVSTVWTMTNKFGVPW